MAYTEANYENAVIQLIEQLGYTHVYGPDVVRDYTDPLYSDVLEGALIAVNPGIPQAAINEALFKLRNIENGKLEQRNIIFTDYLQNGIEVAYFHNLLLYMPYFMLFSLMKLDPHTTIYFFDNGPKQNPTTIDTSANLFPQSLRQILLQYF